VSDPQPDITPTFIISRTRMHRLDALRFALTLLFIGGGSWQAVCRPTDQQDCSMGLPLTVVGPAFRNSLDLTLWFRASINPWTDRATQCGDKVLGFREGRGDLEGRLFSQQFPVDACWCTLDPSPSFGLSQDDGIRAFPSFRARVPYLTYIRDPRHTLLELATS